MSDELKAKCKVVVGPGRMSYPSLLSMKETDNGGFCYEVTLLMPPEVIEKEKAKWRRALEAAMELKFGPNKDKWPSKNFRGVDDVLRMCDDEDNQKPEYKPGWGFMSFRTTQPIMVVDAMKAEVTEAKEVYAGRWAKVSANAYVYNNKSKGVTFGLNAVQLLKHDEAFSAADPRKAVTMFEEEAEAMDGDDDQPW